MEGMMTYLSTLPFWKHLSCEEQKWLEQNSLLHLYPEEKEIRSPDDTSIGLILLIFGEARVCVTSPEGKELTLFTFEKEDACIFGGHPVIRQVAEDVQVITMKRSEVLTIRSSALETLSAKNVYVLNYLYETALKRLPTILEMFEDSQFCRGDQRLAAYLIKRYDKTNDPVIHTTQEQIAEQINSAREVTNRLLKRFSKEGWIECRRGCITLIDIHKLREIAETV